MVTRWPCLYPGKSIWQRCASLWSYCKSFSSIFTLYTLNRLSLCWILSQLAQFRRTVSFFSIWGQNILLHFNRKILSRQFRMSKAILRRQRTAQCTLSMVSSPPHLFPSTKSELAILKSNFLTVLFTLYFLSGIFFHYSVRIVVVNGGRLITSQL